MLLVRPSAIHVQHEMQGVLCGVFQSYELARLYARRHAHITSKIASRLSAVPGLCYSDK